jgi:hypothetical protein
MMHQFIARLTAENAEKDEVIAELRERVDNLLPPLTPDREAIMARLDDEVARLTPYRNSETGGMSTPAPSRTRMLEVIHIARHMLRYANDAESGNIVLRERLAAAERVVAAAEDAMDAGECPEHFGPKSHAFGTCQVCTDAAQKALTAFGDVVTALAAYREFHTPGVGADPAEGEVPGPRPIAESQQGPETGPLADFDCEHHSASGIDQESGPDKIWRCDACGFLFRCVLDGEGITTRVGVDVPNEREVWL